MKKDFDKNDDIPGIVFRTFPKDQVNLLCKIHISFSDALSFCNGNIELQDWLIEKLKTEFREGIKSARPD